VFLTILTCLVASARLPRSDAEVRKEALIGTTIQNSRLRRGSEARISGPRGKWHQSNKHSRVLRHTESRNGSIGLLGSNFRIYVRSEFAVPNNYNGYITCELVRSVAVHPSTLIYTLKSRPYYTSNQHFQYFQHYHNDQQQTTPLLPSLCGSPQGR
jgi:hypothetical protein